MVLIFTPLTVRKAVHGAVGSSGGHYDNLQKMFSRNPQTDERHQHDAGRTGLSHGPVESICDESVHRQNKSTARRDYQDYGHRRVQRRTSFQWEVTTEMIAFLLALCMIALAVLIPFAVWSFVELKRIDKEDFYDTFGR